MKEKPPRPPHIEVAQLLLVANKEARLSEAERAHIRICDDCRDLLATFVRQNLVRIQRGKSDGQVA